MSFFLKLLAESRFCGEATPSGSCLQTTIETKHRFCCNHITEEPQILKNFNSLYVKHGERHEATTQGHPLLTSTHTPCLRPSPNLQDKSFWQGWLSLGCRGCPAALPAISWWRYPWAMGPLPPPSQALLCPVSPRPEDCSCCCAQKSDSLPGVQQANNYTLGETLIIYFRVA